MLRRRGAYGHDWGATQGGEIEALAVMAYTPDSCIRRIDYSSDPGRPQWDRLRAHAANQPVLRDIKTIAPTGWYGAPEHATVTKAEKCSTTSPMPLQKKLEIFSMIDEGRRRHRRDQHLRAAH